MQQRILAVRSLTIESERWRYEFLHGTQVMRRYRGQTVLPRQGRSILFCLSMPILFYAPLTHLDDLQSAYLDGFIANEADWAMHITKLLAEWRNTVLYVRTSGLRASRAVS